MEFIHEDKYPTALKVAGKFVSDSFTRPILNYVLHEENGDIVATDSEKLIRISNIHGFKENTLIHPKTYMVAKGTYPDYKHIIRKTNNDIKIILTKAQVKIWLQMFKSIHNLQKKGISVRNPKIVLTLEKDGNIKFKTFEEEGIYFSLPFTTTNTVTDKRKITFQTSHLRDCLEAFHKMETTETIIYINNPLKPIQMYGDKNIECILMPVRTY